ncbi:hypothetical protein [Pseudomonas sp. CC6-YY-74]|uniref:hypothetical protein n=1 Tax=Pseudomonas sp. CC6-YY-74 TaxID=1930532 RepID=UPI0009A1681E|nr:hypothetical protein [Pseudomonas sp. CC6-YY-74]
MHNVSNLFSAATLVGDTLREVLAHDGGATLTQGIELGCSILLGGQIHGEVPGAVQPNFIASTEDTSYFQAGESKYGKPILDRALSYPTPLQLALRCALICFNSTIRSNRSVGMPLNLRVYQADSFEVPSGLRVREGDAYFEEIRQQCCGSLSTRLGQLAEAPGDYWE